MHIHKDLYTNVYDNVIHNGHTHTQDGNNPNVHQLKDEWTKCGLPYNGVLFNNKKEWSTDTYYNINKPQEHYAWWKKQTQKTVYCIIPFIWLSRKSKSVETESRLVTSWTGEGWVRWWWEWEFFGGEGKSAKIVLCSSLYHLVHLLKYHWIVHLKWVNYMWKKPHYSY